MARKISAIPPCASFLSSRYLPNCWSGVVAAKLSEFRREFEAIVTGYYAENVVHRGYLLMRANKDLSLGAFELDWDGGMVMFRQANVFPELRYDEAIIASLVHNVVAEMDRLGPFLGELCRTKKEVLPLLDVKALLRRQELLPPEPVKN